jgi:hypothetical protein
MKKITIAIVLATLSNFIEAQTTDVSKMDKDFSDLGPAEVNTSSTFERPNTKAVRDFLKSCANAKNTHWYVDSEGSYAYYSLNEKKGRRFYNKKGDFVYDILTYSEENLPFDIRDMVKQSYYLDYNITLVHEIHTEGKLIYIVQIQDKKTLKQVRICDKEIDVISELTLMSVTPSTNNISN